MQETNENENTTIQNLWDSVRAVLKGKIHSNTSLPQETREKSNKWPNFMVSRRKEIIKIRTEIIEKKQRRP